MQAVQVGLAIGKPTHKPKINFYDPFDFYTSYRHMINPAGLGLEGYFRLH